MLGKIKEYKILVIILSLILLFGVNRIISNMIYRNQLDTYELYHTSIQPKNNDEFNYLLSTESGKILFNSDFKAVKNVSLKELKGKYLAIKKIKEKYTMHTRVITYSCGKSTCTRTEVYWTWDYAGTQKKIVKDVIFADKIYQSKLFNFDNYYRRTKVKKKSYMYSGSDTRYYYETIPSKINGSIFVSSRNKKMEDILHKDILIRNEKVKQILKSTEIDNKPEIICNIIFIFIAIAGSYFIYIKLEEL